nr:unnamed protein product [Digitaria exilis]
MAGDGEAPLLERKPRVYFDGCPGCAVERRKAENSGVPYWQFFHIWIVILVSCLPISLLFPFIYFMRRIYILCIFFSTTDKRLAYCQKSGRYWILCWFCGLENLIECDNQIFIGASYMLGRALTSTCWGMVADRIGRKPVIIIGVFATLVFKLVFNTLFGLSLHYWMAIATRFLLGSLNGLLGPIRAYAVEICRTEHQAIGLSLVSTSWAIGLIIGPAIGGYLAQIFSLWAESDKKYGGLSFTSEDVGEVLAITGASILLYQTFIYPQIVKVLGPVNASRVAAVTIVTCSFILQNNSVPQDQRATANGLATTLMSFFKAFAPAGAGFHGRKNANMLPSSQN